MPAVAIQPGFFIQIMCSDAAKTLPNDNQKNVPTVDGMNAPL